MMSQNIPPAVTRIAVPKLGLVEVVHDLVRGIVGKSSRTMEYVMTITFMLCRRRQFEGW